ncbi:MAG TPA: STAS domain-containing protein [Gaiellaceae bacterium]|nr:STAS domain-containing protein [Gaiellaceae bacterium]
MAGGEDVRARAGLRGGGASPGTGVVRLKGDYDMSRAAHVDRLLGEHLGTYDRLYVDLSRVTFMDSSVLSALARAARHARPRGVAFHVVAPAGSAVHRLLSISGLLGHLGWQDALLAADSSPVARRAEGETREPEHVATPDLAERLQQRARHVAEGPALVDSGTHETHPRTPLTG